MVQCSLFFSVNPEVIHLLIGETSWVSTAQRSGSQKQVSKCINATLIFFNVMLKFEAPSETFERIIRKCRVSGIVNVLCLCHFFVVVVFCADFCCESYSTLSQDSVLSFRFFFCHDSMTDLDFLSSSFKSKEQQRFKSKSKNYRVTHAKQEPSCIIIVWN